ncbi:MAG TPA: SET domain-containing protein [Opitutaceae bacterium]|nr:SET domain-containing protein [Opitutaceae bacterium]
MADIHINTCAEALLDGAFLSTIDAAEVRPSRIAGRGLFTLRFRNAGEILCRLDGQVVDSRRFPKVMEELEWNALSPVALLVRPLRTSYGYINHSLTPNVVVSPDGLQLLTSRAVEAGEEFTMDYFAQPVPQAYLESAEGLRLRAFSSRLIA